ncbi:MAG: hypothetical protein DRJ40_11515 [Thermoprotei archaeon]|nr:MAG: hypothetical protein DRJ40_11515 [Thermoprotei archaeon]
MKEILETISRHYKSHHIEAHPVAEDEAEIVIRIGIKGVEPKQLDNIVKILDMFVTGLSKGKLVIPVTKKTKKKFEEEMKKIEKDRKLVQKAFLVAKGLHVEGMENE